VFVLDTNTLIHFFKGAGHVADNLLAVPPRDIAIPAVVLYELEVGVASSGRASRRREQLDAFAANISVLPFNQQAARAAAELRLTLERQGRGIGPLDTLIAGTALAYGGVLVTHNTKEFRRVAGLRLADWF
jgi:tRNA(fMet)-specific endonuclease VapC